MNVEHRTLNVQHRIMNSINLSQTERPVGSSCGVVARRAKPQAEGDVWGRSCLQRSPKPEAIPLIGRFAIARPHVKVIVKKLYQFHENVKNIRVYIFGHDQ